MSRRRLSLILIGLGAILALGTPTFLSFFEEEPSLTESSLLGVLKNPVGEVLLKRFGNTDGEKITSKTSEEKLSLHHLDLVSTQPQSQVLLLLPSGYELLIGPSSQVLIEAWSSAKPSPLYLHLLKGSYEVLRTGQRGQVFILRDRRTFYPEGGLNSETTPQLLISTNENPLEPATAEPSSSQQEEQSQVPSSAKPSSLQTLSNEELDETLARQRPQFERCQANALREELPATGSVLVGITISNEGKVTGVKAITSDIKNEHFERCIMSVMERTRFRPFAGGAITRSYPLVFE